MFYDINLLCPKRKGKFAIIWLAATRGLTYVKRNIDKVNIVQVCTEILQFVNSDSRSPRRRLSLYLSAQLTYGTVLVYCEQVKMLECQVAYFSITIKRPIFRCLPEEEEERRKKRKVSKPRKPRVVPPTTLGEIQLDEHLRDVPQIEELNQNITDPIHITLPEEQSTRFQINDVELFGDEGQIDLQLAQLEDISRIIQQPEPHPIPPITNEEGRIASEKRQIETVEEVEQSPSKRRRSEIRPRPVTPLVRVQQHGTISPNGEDRNLMPPPPSPREIPPRTPTRRSDRVSTHPEPVYGRESPRVRRRRPRRLEWDTIGVLDSPNGSCLSSEFSIRSDVMSLFSQKPNIPQSRQSEEGLDIIGDLLRCVSHTEEDVREILNGTSPAPSRRLRSRTRASTQQPQAAVPVIEVTEPEIVPEIHQTAVPNITFPNVTFPSPRVSRVEPIQPHQEVSLDDIRQQRVYTSTPIGIETEAKRHSQLLNRIRQLFDEIEGPLTLEHICQPLNRLTVARTFSGLLNLSAQGYTILTSHDYSIELKEIYPGPRL